VNVQIRLEEKDMAGLLAEIKTNKRREIYTQYYCRKIGYNNRIYPTHLAIKAAMEFGLEHNLQAVNLMGAGMGDSYRGIRNYKKQFGAVVENGRYFKILRPVLFHLRKIAVNGLGRLNKLIR